jgi:aromatic amino acid aminotransferase I / 2-aminoadipate transaminase
LTNGGTIDGVTAAPAIAHHESNGGAVASEQIPEPVTLADIAARRTKAGKLVAGTAAYSDSDMFKSPVSVFTFSFSF